MTTFKKIVLFIALCLMFSSVTVFARSIEWNWTTPDENISFYRYRFNDGEWTVVDKSVTNAELKNCKPDTDYTLSLESSYDGNVWSETVSDTITTPPRRLLLRLKLSAASMSVYDFFKGHDIEGAKALTTSEPGMGLGLNVGYLVGKNFELNLGYKFAFMNKAETIEPKALLITNHIVSGGMNYHIPITSLFSISTGLDFGALFALNANSYSVSPMLGANLGLNIITSDKLTLSFGTGCSIAYNHSKEPLYKSMTYIIDGLTFALEVRI